jgi:hypothetical protein
LGSHCERIEPGAGIIEVGWAHLLDDVAVKVVEHQSDDAIRLAGCRRQFGSPKGSKRMLTRHSFKVRSGHKPRLWKGRHPKPFTNCNITGIQRSMMGEHATFGNSRHTAVQLYARAALINSL